MFFKKSKKFLTKAGFSKENLPLDPALKDKFLEKYQRHLKITEEAVALSWMTKAELRDVWVLLKQPREFFEVIVDMIVSGQTDVLTVCRMLNLTHDTQLTAKQLATILRYVIPRFYKLEHEGLRPKREAREAKDTEDELALHSGLEREAKTNPDILQL